MSRPRPVSVDVCKYEISEAGGKRHAVYVCRVHVTQGRAPWYILRRYKQWEDLLDSLEDVAGRAKLPSLPGKKVFGNMEAKFLEARRRDLQAWMTEIVRAKGLCESDAMWHWLQPQQADAEYGRGSSPGELMLDSGPPAMQGALELVDPTNGFVRRWFELRGTVLVWFRERDGERLDVVDLGNAIVTTSRALQCDPARTGAEVGLVSPVPGGRASFFSIQSGGSEYVMGAASEAEMRAWVSAILSQQGDKSGAAAFAMGRSSITSHGTAVPLGSTPPVHQPPGGQLADPLAGGDPLGAGDPLGTDDPLGVTQEGVTAPLGLPGLNSVKAGVATATRVEAAFRRQGGTVARVQVRFAAGVLPLHSKQEPEPEPELEGLQGAQAPGARILCICQLDSEFGIVHLESANGGQDLMGVLATIPVVASLQYSQPTDGGLTVTLAEEAGAVHEHQTGGLQFEFTGRQEVDGFVQYLEESRRIAEGAGQLHANDRTHQWLSRLAQLGSQAAGSSELVESDTAASLLSGSSAFWGSTDETYLLDPERRRRLKSSAAADSTGAQNVRLLPHTTFGQGMSGQASLQTRTEMRDGKKVTVYELALDRQGFQWTVSRRYSDFVTLQENLKSSWPAVMKRLSSHFPSKGFLSSTDPEVIFHRSTQLFKWLESLMDDPQATRAKELISFLGMKVNADEKLAHPGNNFWQPNQTNGGDNSGSARPGGSSAAFASVDRLGRSITQLINEQSSLATPDEVSQQLLECRAFRDALLTPIFDAKRLDSGGGRVRLKLLGDSLWVAGTGSCEAEIEPYTTMNISFDPPTLTLACAETDATKRFEIGAADGQRMVAELDDRIQLARHMMRKEEQWKLSQFDSIEFQRRAVGSGGRGDRTSTADYRRKLDELSGKTESERIGEAVDKILSGASTEDQREITRPLLHFLSVTFGTLQDDPGAVALHVREVMTDLQETILDPDGDRNAGLVGQLAEASSEALENLSRIVNERLELVVVAPIVEQIEECLQRSFEPAHLQRVNTQREALRAKPQEYFGIAADSTSPSGWRAAIDEVDQIAQRRMPSGQLQALLKCTTKVYELFTAERAAVASAAAMNDPDAKPPAEQFLAADEFLSVFIFVLVQSSLESLPITCRYMSELCDPELLSGQHGYYLTVFESAIQCIADADADREMISAVVRTSSSVSLPRGSAMSPLRMTDGDDEDTAGDAAEEQVPLGQSPRSLSSEDDEDDDDEDDDGRAVDSPLSTGRGDSDDDVDLFAHPKQPVPAAAVQQALAQDDLDDSPLFQNARRIPSRKHPARRALSVRNSDSSDEDESPRGERGEAGDDTRDDTRDRGGVRGEAFDSASGSNFERVSTATSYYSAEGSSSSVSDLRCQLEPLGAGEGEAPRVTSEEAAGVLSPPPPVIGGDAPAAIEKETEDTAL